MPKIRRHPLITAIISLGMGHQAIATPIIEPSVVTVGKGETIQLLNHSLEEGQRLTLSPGGPIVQQQLPLAPGTYGQYQLQEKQGDLALLQQTPGGWTELALFHTQTPAAVYRNNTLFSAEGEEGLVIYEGKRKRGLPLGRYLTSAPALDVSVSNDMAFIATGHQGLTVLDISDIQRPLWLGSHQKLGRVIRVVAENNRVLVLNEQNTLFLIDVSNPKEPTVVSLYHGQAAISDIALQDKTVYARTAGSVDVIDFSATSPQISNIGLDFGQGVNFGGERRVHIEGSLAYVADWFSGIHIYDISRPTVPMLLSSFHTPGSPKGIVVRDHIAYVADDDHGLQIIDVHDPLKPKKLSSLQTKGLAYTPKLANNLLYLASHRGGFQIIDISNPRKPKLLSELDTPGKAWSIALKKQLAYVADDDNGLLIFDVSQPLQPQLVGQFAPGAAVEEVIIRDQLAYLATFDAGLYILDIQDPTQPQMISHTPLAGNSRGLDLVENHLYVAGWLAGVHILDISDAAAPRLISSYDTRGATWGVKVKNHHLFAMDWWGGIKVLDISRPQQPIAAGGYHERGQVNHITVRGKHAFVANGSNGMQVFDIKNPLNPTWMTGVNFVGNARKIVIDDRFAYLAMGDDGLAIADINEPYQVRWVSQTDSLGTITDVVAGLGPTFVLDSQKGIIALATHKPASPTVMYRLNIEANQIIAHQYELIAITDDQLIAFQVNKDGTLSQQYQYPLKHPGKHVSSGGNLLYIGQGNELHVILLNKRGFEKIHSFKMSGPITAIAADKDRVIASTVDELVEFATNSSQPAKVGQYSLVHKPTYLEFNSGIAYISGEKTVTALQLLPAVTPTGKTSFKLPNSLAEGSYHIVFTDKDGQNTVFYNALSIDMPRFSKPRLSLEEFNKLLKQNQNSDVFVKPTK